MIAYTDIYQRFINEIDDPQLNKANATNPIQFQKLCYRFLENGLVYFTAPIKATEMLSQRDLPVGATEFFDGNDTNVYTIEMSIPTGAEIVCSIGDSIDYGAVVEDNTVTFSKNVPVGTVCSVDYYVPGAFTGDFSKTCGQMNVVPFKQRIIEILAKAMVIAWADKEQNFMLDIRNLLNDTDFKLHSPANSLKTKIEWVNCLRYDIYSIQNKLDWDLRHQNRSKYNY